MRHSPYQVAICRHGVGETPRVRVEVNGLSSENRREDEGKNNHEDGVRAIGSELEVMIVGKRKKAANCPYFGRTQTRQTAASSGGCDQAQFVDIS